jgi:hypothetical protein
MDPLVRGHDRGLFFEGARDEQAVEGIAVDVRELRAPVDHLTRERGGKELPRPPLALDPRARGSR